MAGYCRAQSDNEQEDQQQRGQDADKEAIEQLDEEEGQYRDIKGEVAGNIHKSDYRKFWWDVLKPDNYVRKIIESGYRLLFENEEPGRYEEPNNKSAITEMSYVREEVKEMLRKKSVTEVFHKPYCVNPLTVSIRDMGVGKKKKRRLCLDLSRWVNKHIRKESTKLTGLEKSCGILLQGDMQATYDLSAAYHHVRIHDEHKKFLCFMVPEEDGTKRYFQFEVMPFGLASATQCLARVTKPICAHLAGKGIRHSRYIDDGKINARKKEMPHHLKYTLQTAQKSGFCCGSQEDGLTRLGRHV